jgi:transcription antitermination factor NusG
MSDWYAMLTRPKNEFDAVNELRKRGLDAWTPKEVVWKQVRRRDALGRTRKTRMPVEFPEAPRYVFFSFGDNWQNWGIPFRSRFCSAVIMEGPERPARADQRAFMAYMAQNDRKAFRAYGKGSVNQRKSFKPGDMVSIKSGTWEGRTVALSDIVSKYHGKVILELFGAAREVTVDLAHLEAA